MYKPAILLVILLQAAVSSALAVTCAGGGPRPGWVDAPDAGDGAYYYAVGVADGAALSMSDRLEVAKQGALKSLAESVEVTVKNTLLQEQSSHRSGGREFNEETFQSITRTTTNASLRNVEVVATWEAPATCAFWVRVRISRDQVERSRQEAVARSVFAIFSEQLALAQKDGLAPAQRQGALEMALDLYPRLKLDLIPDASSPGYYNGILKRLQKELSSAQGDADQARAAIKEADRLVFEASEQIDEAAKARMLAGAWRQYRTQLQRYPGGVAGLFGPGDIYFKLGELEEVRGNRCLAKSSYAQASEAKQVNDRQSIAKKRAEALLCSPDDMEKSRWRQYFEGRSVQLVCYYKAGEDQGVWSKACDGVNGILRSFGADVMAGRKKITSVQAKEIQDGVIPAGFLDDRGPVIAVLAVGKMTGRVDPDSASRQKEFHFDGALGTVLFDEGKVVFADRFQGRTGWNPVSPQMVMDVLAINVVNRWKEKFSIFLQPRGS